MTAPRRTSTLLILAAVAAAGSGCALFEAGQSWLVGKPMDWDQAERNTPLPGSPLAKIPEMRQAIQLEVYFVERPVGDPLIERSLWSEIIKWGSLTPEDRQKLVDNGFCVGITPSTPPRAVQALLGISSEVPDHSGRVASHPVLLPSGGSTVIPCTQQPHAACTVQLNNPAGEEVRDFDNAQCRLKLVATRTPYGWVKLDFQPEVHHGAHAVRPVAAMSQTGLDWNLQEGQKVTPLHHQRFTLDLNVGEWAVVGHDAGAEASAGSVFFTGKTLDLETGLETDVPVRRAIVIHVAEVQTAKAVRAERSW